ncbi:MAG: hypothetical protein ACRDU9_07710 [Acidimicrobiia bacterium]
MKFPKKSKQAHAVSLLMNVRFRYQVGAIDAATARRSAKYTIATMSNFPESVAEAERFVLGETNIMFGHYWVKKDIH